MGADAYGEAPLYLATTDAKTEPPLSAPSPRTAQKKTTKTKNDNTFDGIPRATPSAWPLFPRSSSRIRPRAPYGLRPSALSAIRGAGDREGVWR